jgi:UDP-N-acetyl-D-glucosamine dehydrogenase
MKAPAIANAISSDPTCRLLPPECWPCPSLPPEGTVPLILRPEPQQVEQPFDRSLLDAITAREARVGIVGLGYVGLPLLLAFHAAGFRVTGFDIDPAKIDALRKGQPYIRHIGPERVAELATSNRFTATTDYSAARECDALILCVPTPLTRNREPDMTYVRGTCEAIAPHLHAGQLVSLESTTYPGTTEEVVVPVLEEGSGLKAGRDFHVAYSPEREDPNNAKYSTTTIPKLVGGLTPACRDAAVALYASVVSEVIPVANCKVAEAAKLVENIFRSVNIAMVNELKIVFDRMGIDVWEVIDAAKTKPFGFMPFYPGPGLGGHCIPIDPFYLTWKAREFDSATRFIELAGEINTAMPYYVMEKTIEALNDAGKPLRGSRLMLVGLSYKADVDDKRESPTLKLIDLFEARGARADYHDPHIPEITPSREHDHLTGRHSVSIDTAGEYDAVVICTAHSSIDYTALGNQASLIIDTRNAMASVQNTKAVVVKA